MEMESTLKFLDGRKGNHGEFSETFNSFLVDVATFINICQFVLAIIYFINNSRRTKATKLDLGSQNSV